MQHANPVNYVTGTNCIVEDDHQYTVPTKLIKTVDDMAVWEKSEAYLEYLGFILTINDAVRGIDNEEGSQNCSERILKLHEMIEDIDKILDETPPIDQPQRFGNQAFRTFYQKISDNLFVLLQKVLPECLYRAIPEIMVYLLESFGNATRIDYGTGHEISFLMFLCCLYKIGFLNDEDKVPTACKVFARYLDFVRKLQTTYRMEPAGSHGVWSLDDYQFVPFIWGSSQLVGHQLIEPGSILKQDMLDAFGSKYLFLSCLVYINKVKTGPFAEHSHVLWSISGVHNWIRVNGGLVKMYKAEVLQKFPVVQHIVFGTLLPLKQADPDSVVRKRKDTYMAPPKGLAPAMIRSAVSRSQMTSRSLAGLMMKGKNEEARSTRHTEDGSNMPPPPPPSSRAGDEN